MGHLHRVVRSLLDVQYPAWGCGRSIPDEPIVFVVDTKSDLIRQPSVDPSIHDTLYLFAFDYYLRLLYKSQQFVISRDPCTELHIDL